MEPGDVIGGRYRLERRLASGGMGAVWTARHVELETEVAVKFLHAEHAASADGEARFRREAKAAARLRSPSIVQIFDFGVHDGAAYMAMERLVGVDLGDLIDREGAQSVSRVRTVLADVAVGLGLAHGAGIIHRDLKPSNIFLAEESGRVQAKLVDFGIAKETGTPLVSDAKTSTGVLIGSPHYMSPEQARGLTVDPRSDLWSLAVVLYEALTGLLPFEGRTIGEIIAKICADPIPLPSESTPALAPLDTFFRKALCREPAGRYPDIGSFVAAFEDGARHVGDFTRPAVVAPAATVGRETSTPTVSEVKPRPAPRARRGLWLAVAALGALAFGGLALSRPGSEGVPAFASAEAPLPQPPVASPPSPEPAPVAVVPASVDVPAPEASASASAAVSPAAPPKKGSSPSAASPTAKPAKPPAPAKAGVDDTFGIPLSKP